MDAREALAPEVSLLARIDPADLGESVLSVLGRAALRSGRGRGGLDPIWSRTGPYCVLAVLLGGSVRYVLSSGGHIAGVVNPPGPKSWYEASQHYPRSERRQATTSEVTRLTPNDGRIRLTK